MLKFWVPTPPRFLAFTFIILFFVLLRLVIFLLCRNRLVRFVQHIGVRISNHEQPNGKLPSLQTMIETSSGYHLFSAFIFLSCTIAKNRPQQQQKNLK